MAPTSGNNTIRAAHEFLSSIQARCEPVPPPLLPQPAGKGEWRGAAVSPCDGDAADGISPRCCERWRDQQLTGVHGSLCCSRDAGQLRHARIWLGNADKSFNLPGHSDYPRVSTAVTTAAPAWTLLAMWHLSAAIVGKWHGFLWFKAYMNPWNSTIRFYLRLLDDRIFEFRK